MRGGLVWWRRFEGWEGDCECDCTAAIAGRSGEGSGPEAEAEGQNGRIGGDGDAGQE